MKRRVSLLLLAALLAGSSLPVLADTVISPVGDLRLRQEILDGVFYFAPDPDLNQVRVRTRVGLDIKGELDTFKLLLANEHRHYIHPDDRDFDWDEVVVDQLYWDHQAASVRWTIGRQNIIWDEGFLMLESSPYDGSRTIYHDAVRVRGKLGGADLDAAVVDNQKMDPHVLIDDKDRRLRDADERGLALRLEQGPVATSYILKREKDPDDSLPVRTTHTLSTRREGGLEDGMYWMYEIAGQYHKYERSDGYSNSGWGFAFHTRMEFPSGDRGRGEFGYFSYDRTFRTPWGRWPLWSELYIYTLIGESSSNRVHVAAWENVAAPFAGLRHEFNDGIKGKARLYWLLAPSNWETRGLLLQTRLDFKLSSHASGHLTWEMLNPGEFHDTLAGQELDTQHFLRWEIILKL